MRGGTVAFNVMNREGTTVPFAVVVDRAREAGVSLRGGCFCNPGAAEAAFQFPADLMTACLDRAGRNFTIDGLSECLGPEVPVGAVRASVGIATNETDIDRALEVIGSFS
jgi:selenocysteine lyase/cysteine desulfurase